MTTVLLEDDDPTGLLPRDILRGQPGPLRRGRRTVSIAFPAKERDHLIRIFNERVKHDPKSTDHFIGILEVTCFQLTDSVNLKDGRVPNAKERKEVKDLAETLRAALLQIEAMDPRTRWLIEGAASANRAPEPAIWRPSDMAIAKSAWGDRHLLTNTHRLVTALCRAAEEVANVNPRLRDDEQKRKSLTFMAVTAYRNQFGRLPPKGQASWFAAFMAELGQLCGCGSCGGRVVREAIEAEARAMSADKARGLRCPPVTP